MTCPRCHGKYFGTIGDTYYCHCAADGSHLDVSPEACIERKRMGLPMQKACGWKGPVSEARKDDEHG